MKKIFLLFTISMLSVSCSTDVDNGPEYSLVTLPVSSVEMPTEFAKDSITEIPVTYIKPSNCYHYEGFYYAKNDFTRTVAIYATEFENLACTQNIMPSTSILEFKPIALGTYHFKFWTGTNSQNVDQFLEYDVVVDH